MALNQSNSQAFNLNKKKNITTVIKRSVFSAIKKFLILFLLWINTPLKIFFPFLSILSSFISAVSFVAIIVFSIHISMSTTGWTEEMIYFIFVVSITSFVFFVLSICHQKLNLYYKKLMYCFYKFLL